MALRKSAIIEKAQKLVFKGLFRQAIKEWKRLLSETPNDGNIFNAIGDLHLKTGDKENATASFIQSADAFRVAGFELKSIALFKKALKVDPARVEINEKLASVYAERGLIGNAIDDYLKAAKHYLEQGDFRSSLSTYRKISQLDPNNENICMEIAEICQNQGLKDEALDEYKKVMAIYAAHNRTADLEGVTRKILEIDPDYYKQKGPPLQEGDKSELTPHLETDPDLLGSHSPEAVPEETASGFLEPEPIPMAEEFTIYADEHPSRTQQKKEAQLKANEQDPSLESGLTEADVYLKYGLTEKAIQSFDRLVASFPEALEPHIKLKEIYLAQENLGKAVESCSRLASLYGKRKDPEKKEAVLNELMALELRRKEKEASLETDFTAEPALSEEDTIISPDSEELSLLRVEPDASGDLFPKSESLGPLVSEVADAEASDALAPEVRTGFSISKSEALLSNFSSPDESLEETIPAIDLELNAVLPENEILASIPEETSFASIDPFSAGSLQDLEGGVPSEREASLIGPDETKAAADEKDCDEQSPAAKGLVEERLSVPDPGREDEENPSSSAPSFSLQPASESEGYVNLQDILSEDLESEIGVEGASQYAQSEAGENSRAQEIETQYDLGIAYKEMGMLPKAMKAFEQAAKGDRRFGDAMNMLVACHREVGSIDPAIELIRNGLSRSHCQGAVEIALKYELALLYELKGNRPEAASLYDDIFRADPSFREVASKVNRPASSGGAPLFSPQNDRALFSDGEKAKRRNRVSYL